MGIAHASRRHTNPIGVNMSVYPDIAHISIHRLVPFFCMSSYLYYKQNKCVLTDGDFDLLCKRMLENWDDIKHPHKYKIRKKDLEAGTGYAMVYTNMIVGSAESWYNAWERECGK